jgi:hypothetical protein
MLALIFGLAQTIGEAGGLGLLFRGFLKAVWLA